MVINIALLGFGTVGSGLPELLLKNRERLLTTLGDELVICKILMRNQAAIDRACQQGFNEKFVLSIDEILSDETISIVIELMGGLEPAKSYISKALSAGKNVVTANKDLIATYGVELQKLAKENHVALYYEAAVAGGIPILRTLANSYVSDKVSRILGIINGTSNFMLTKMVDSGWSYDQALSEAQSLGFAEANPTNDVDGIDASYKLAILSEFAFGMTLSVQEVNHSGIRTISHHDVSLARQLGYVIKLVGEIIEVSSGIFAEVSPTFVPKAHPLSSVNDVMNAVFIESEGIGESMFYGPGAGQKPTGTSVLADVIRVAKRINDGTIGKGFNEYARTTQLALPIDIKSKYYFSVETPDTAGQFLRLVTIFTAEGASFEQVVQEKGNGKRAVVVLICYAINRTQLKNIQEKLEKESDFVLLNSLKVLGD